MKREQQIAAAQQGMDAAIEHADRVHNMDWADVAYTYLSMFMVEHNDNFICEEVRIFAEANNCPVPPDARAWGGVMAKARNRGLLTKAGISYAGAHGRYTTLWAKA